MTHKLKRLRVEEYAYIMSTNLVKTLVWKHEYDIINRTHQMQMTTICHWMNPPMKIFCVRHY